MQISILATNPMQALRSVARRLVESELTYRSVLALLRHLPVGNSRSSPSVVLFKPDGLGDFVVASGLIRFLLRLHEDTPVALVVTDLVAPLARREFPSCETYNVPFSDGTFWSGLVGKYLKARHALQPLNPSTVISLRYHANLYHDLLLAGLRAPMTYGCNRASSLAARDPLGDDLFRFRPTKEFSYPSPDENKPNCPAELQAHLRLATILAGRQVQAAEVAPRLETFGVCDNGALLVVPFGRVSIRNYPAGLLGRALEAARLPPKTRVRVCAQPAAREAVSRVAQAIAARNQTLEVGIVTPATTVGLAEEVAAARCVLSMESAAGHMATALDKPAAVLLGGGHFGLFGPWTRSARQHWLWQRVDCYGCDWRCRHAEPLCITQIDPSKVGASIHELFRPT